MKLISIILVNIVFSSSIGQVSIYKYNLKTNNKSLIEDVGLFNPLISSNNFQISLIDTMKGNNDIYHFNIADEVVSKVRKNITYASDLDKFKGIPIRKIYQRLNTNQLILLLNPNVLASINGFGYEYEVSPLRFGSLFYDHAVTINKRNVMYFYDYTYYNNKVFGSINISSLDDSYFSHPPKIKSKITNPDKKFIPWYRRTKQLFKTIIKPERKVTELAVSPDEKWLLFVQDSVQTKIVNLRNDSFYNLDSKVPIHNASFIDKCRFLLINNKEVVKYEVNKNGVDSLASIKHGLQGRIKISWSKKLDLFIIYNNKESLLFRTKDFSLLKVISHNNLTNIMIGRNNLLYFVERKTQ